MIFRWDASDGIKPLEPEIVPSLTSKGKNLFEIQGIVESHTSDF
jgi:hypothetical protein